MYRKANHTTQAQLSSYNPKCNEDINDSDNDMPVSIDFPPATVIFLQGIDTIAPMIRCLLQTAPICTPDRVDTHACSVSIVQLQYQGPSPLGHDKKNVSLQPGIRRTRYTRLYQRIRGHQCQDSPIPGSATKKLNWRTDR